MHKNLTELAKHDKLINEFVMVSYLKPGWELNMAIVRCLDKAYIEGYDGIDMLYQALKKIKDPAKVSLQEIKIKTPEKGTSTNARLKCNMCDKIFEKGINSWIGGKRSCKQSCTVENLCPV